jgi:hypothetical protein
MESAHCPEEIELLKLLTELQSKLIAALDSLANTTPASAESRYIGDAAISVNHAADAYLLLRESGRVDASKLLIRPMVDVVISATTVIKKKGFLFRKAYTALQEMKKLYDRTPANEASANAYLERLKKTFQKEPGYPIACKPVDAHYTAEVAGLLPVYEKAYRIYCEFTHSSTRAMRGVLNPPTDPIDTSMVIWAVFLMLEYLQQHTPAVTPDLSAFRQKHQRLQAAMLHAWVESIP